MYEIIIKEKRTVKKQVGNDWKIVGKKEALYSGGKTEMVDDYGYTPLIEKEVEEEIEILRQVVETIDFVGVVKAINGIK